MRKKKLVIRRTAAALTAMAVLWTVFTLGGSNTWKGAWEELQKTAPVALLRQQLGTGDSTKWLTSTAAFVIAQSPLLIGSREQILSLQSEDDSDGQTPEEPETEEIRETPEEPEPILTPFPDNGVKATTLVPQSTEGYLIKDLAYVNNYSDKEITEEQLQGDFAAVLGDSEPQVLIIHTHGSEAYTMPPGEEYVASGDWRTTDAEKSVVRVGDEIAKTLGEYGISVVHDRTMYDYPQYNGAYDRSLVSMEAYLQKYPSISFILDIHRDAIVDSEGNPYKVVAQVGQQQAAQLSFIVGTDGGGLAHDHWLENLKLCAAVQNTLLSEYPTLMRPITVRNSRYNQHCTLGSMLVEVGTAGNSLDEALLSARLFGEGLAKTLQNKSGQTGETVVS